MPATKNGQVRGRCSRCEAEFPLATRRIYRLIPSRGVGGGAIAAQATGAAAATVDWPDLPAAREADVVESALPAEPSKLAEVGRLIRDVLILAVLVTAGGAAGYYLHLLELPVLEDLDHFTRTALGATIGLLLAWIIVPRKRQNC